MVNQWWIHDKTKAITVAQTPFIAITQFPMLMGDSFEMGTNWRKN